MIDQLPAVFRQPEIVAGTWKAARTHADEISEADARAALQQLAPLWDELFPAERARIVTLLVERVDIGADRLNVRLRVDGLGSLAREMLAGEALHHRHMKGDERARPRPSTRAAASDPAAPPTEGFTADAAQWVVFEHAGGERPDLRATAILCDTLRVALMEGWTRVHGRSAPGWIAGHEADGAPARAAHIAVAPMANLGWKHSDGRLMGLALLPPKAITARWAEPGPGLFGDRQAFLRVMASLGEADAEGSRLLTLAPRQGKGGWEWRLRPAESGAHSLAPARYLRAAAHWASVTPVLLDRHIKAEGDAARAESIDIVARACERIGLPRPVSVELGKYSAIRGAPPAWPPGGAPNWQNWSRKTSFGQRRLFHVRLGFAEPVPGPVLIGAGRFVGLGLCLPVKEAP